MVRRARAAGNVTVPYKEQMFHACDSTTTLAARVGAVNVFWIDDGDQLCGDNTDVGGFNAAIATGAVSAGGPGAGRLPRDITVGVIGAGGAAAAVLAAVEGWSGCHAHVYNRTPERARLLCARFRTFANAVDDIAVIGGAQIVVNATSIGIADDSLPIDPAFIHADARVIDLVPKAGDTAFVRELRRRGTQAESGIHMLVEQAALAYQQWFGLTPDRSRMAQALSAR